MVCAEIERRGEERGERFSNVFKMINIYTGEVMCWLVELQSSWSPLELYNIDPYHDISDTAQPLTNTLLLSSSPPDILRVKTISASPPHRATV